jgi:hypothetical protein
MNLTLIIVIVAVVITAIIGYFVVTKQIKSAWRGTLVDKKESRNRVDRQSVNGAQYSIYYLIFETNSGKKVKISVNGDFYDKCKIGDKYEKKAGELNPQKI